MRVERRKLRDAEDRREVFLKGLKKTIRSVPVAEQCSTVRPLLTTISCAGGSADERSRRVFTCPPAAGLIVGHTAETLSSIGCTAL